MRKEPKAKEPAKPEVSHDDVYARCSTRPCARFCWCALGCFYCRGSGRNDGSALEGPLGRQSRQTSSRGDQSGDDAIVVTAVNVGGASTGCTAEQVAAENRGRPGRRSGGVPPWSPLVSPCHDQRHRSEQDEGRRSRMVITHTKILLAASGLPRNRIEQRGPPFRLSCSLLPVPSCSTSEPVDPGDVLVVTIRVHVETGVEGMGKLMWRRCRVAVWLACL